WSAAYSSPRWPCAPWSPRTGVLETKTPEAKTVQVKGLKTNNRRCFMATLPTAKANVVGTKLARIQPMAYKLVVMLYRIFGILVLYLVLAGILSYAFVMGFYAANNSWAAPVILAPSDDKSLDFTQKIVTSKQTLEDLKVDVQRLQKSISEM